MRKRTVAEIQSSGGTALGIEVDVRDHEAVGIFRQILFIVTRNGRYPPRFRDVGLLYSISLNLRYIKGNYEDFPHKT
jgi:hypothetical protein